MNTTTNNAIDKQQGSAFVRVLQLLKNEDQRIAYAVLEGMQLQKKLDEQNHATKIKDKST